MSYKKKRALSYVVVACLVLIASLCRHEQSENMYVSHLFEQYRSSIYIGLYCAWVVYLNKHVVERKMRKCLTWIGCLMVFWFLIRTIKYLIIVDSFGSRVCWYLYYIPMILIPTLGLIAALLMDEGDEVKTKKQTVCLLIPASIMILAVLTNDFHQKVFYFPEGFLLSNEIYHYGLVFFIIQAWMMFCMIIMEVVLVCKSRIPGKTWFWFPIVPGFLLLVWNVCTMLRLPLIKVIAGDMTATCCLFQAAGGLNAEITDANFERHYQSGTFPNLTQEVRQGLLTASLVMRDGIRINHLFVQGGHLFWTEDISLLTDQYEDIKEQQEELKARKRLLQKTYQQEAKRRKAEEQNRLLNLIQSQTTGQLELMTHFMEELEVTESKDVYERLLAQIIVIGTYLKRRKNLLLTMNNDSQAGLTEEDLIQSLAESCSALKLCQVRALYYVNVRPLVLHDADIVQCYDYFEWLTEQLFGKMQMMFFRVVVMEEHLVISVHVDSEYDLQTLLSGRSGTEVQKEDEKEWLIRWRIS